ncbi:MAG: PepSY domain-containing protein [Pseudomonadales bacterium]
MLLRSFVVKVVWLVSIGLLAGQAQATGLMSCDVPREDWGTKEDLRAKLDAEGWEVRKIKVDEGCYEVYGKTPEGERVEAYFDPASFDKLLVARRGEILFRKAE